jgi:S-(hydroxymethyl)glutathione dehydrogenase / alcohol dehydrogenase
MKAAVCYEFGKPLVIEDVSLAAPKANEVKVKLAACAICHSDILYADGGWGGTLPAVYGHEAAGVIEEVGLGVQGLKLGDHVVVSLIRSCGCCYYCSQGEPTLCETSFPLDAQTPLQGNHGPLVQGLRTGAFAEYVVVEASQVVKIPESMPLDSASLLACGVITGLGAVTHTAKVPTGSSVVVIGLGGVGLNSIQGAVLCGAQPIIGVDTLESKLESARQFGATHGVLAQSNVKEVVLDLTNGRGADYVFVTVGSSKAMAQGLTLIRRGGTYVQVGMPASGVMLEVESANFAGDAQRILGSKMGSVRPQVDIPKLVNLYQQGRLKLDELITKRYKLEGINEAIVAVKRGEALRNVIVF